MMDFVFKMMDFVFKMMNFVLMMMNFEVWYWSMDPADLEWGIKQ